MQFRRSGRTLTWDGQDASLLDFAERHGVAVESGCRSGGCGSCETRLSSKASVQYEHAPDHDVAPGHCLLCVGRPAIAAGAGGLMPLKARLFRREVLPFLASFAALAAGRRWLLDAPAAPARTCCGSAAGSAFPARC